jgi:bacteriocin biosynthesis cyclodehydratase domain-containing protein
VDDGSADGAIAATLPPVTSTPHPLLPAATPVLRVGARAVQVGGVDSGSGVRIGPDAADLARLLRGLDGRRAQRSVLAEAGRAGLDPATVTGVLGGLRAAGLLLDIDPADLLAADAGPAAAARTAAELPAALSSGPTGTAWRRRRAAVVAVEGATRVGVPLAAVLAASGVGRISVRDTGMVSAGDVIVGGLDAADEGRPRAVAAADAIRRASPLTDLRPLSGEAADLVVLARPWAGSDPLVTAALDPRVPHLVATVRGEIGVVGPLVVPGVTSCLHCADLYRRDADPGWPRLAAQLTAAEPPPSGATVTCLVTVATAALQVLAYLDGGAAPVTLGATVELRPPDLRPRLRRWPPHPGCDCRVAPDDTRQEHRAALPGEVRAVPPGATDAPQGRMDG